MSVAGGARRGRGGFTLVELMIVVAILGVIAAIAIPAYSRYVKKSRTAEVADWLNKMWVGSVSYYSDDHVDSSGQVLPKQFPVSAIYGPPECGCLPGGKCPPFALEVPTTQALMLSMPGPFVYRPAYDSSGVEADSQFTALVIGDLDCDATLSYYARRGRVDPTNGDVVGNTQPFVVNPDE